MDNRRLMQRIKSGHVRNIKFGDFVRLIESYGFWLQRVHGSHHLFVHGRIPDTLNIQPEHGQAKAYQVKDF